MSHRSTKFTREVLTVMDNSGIPYTIESGKKHLKIMVEDKLFFVFSHGAKAYKNTDCLRSAIRRVQNVAS